MEGESEHRTDAPGAGVQDEELASLAESARRLAEIVERLERERCLLIVGSTRRYLWYRFLGGVASGIGSAIGATVVVGVVLVLLQHFLGQMQILPVVGKWAAELWQFIQTYSLQK
jgi:hypothetical protein